MEIHSGAVMRAWARIGGLLYLVIIIAGLFGELFVRNALIVHGDPAATADHILASETLWRIGIAGDLVMHICDLPLALIVYLLLKPVNRPLALLALLFGLIQTAVLVANKLNLLVPLFLLGDADYLQALAPAQQQVLAYLSLKAHDHGFGIGLIFFGCDCLITGFLIFKSRYLPRTIGVLMQVAGACYLVNSFALVAAPSFAGAIFPAILMPSFLGELSFCLWLIVKGVDGAKWEQRALGQRLR